MNAKQRILKLGVAGLLADMKDKGVDTLGEYVALITGEPCGSFGIMTGGVLLDCDTWDLLENIYVPPCEHPGSFGCVPNNCEIVDDCHLWEVV